MLSKICNEETWVSLNSLFGPQCTRFISVMLYIILLYQTHLHSGSASPWTCCTIQDSFCAPTCGRPKRTTIRSGSPETKMRGGRVGVVTASAVHWTSSCCPGAPWGFVPSGGGLVLAQVPCRLDPNPIDFMPWLFHVTRVRYESTWTCPYYLLRITCTPNQQHSHTTKSVLPNTPFIATLGHTQSWVFLLSFLSLIYIFFACPPPQPALFPVLLFPVPFRINKFFPRSPEQTMKY